MSKAKKKDRPAPTHRIVSKTVQAERRRGHAAITKAAPAKRRR